MDQTCRYLLNAPDRPTVKLDRKFNEIIKSDEIYRFHRRLRCYAATPLVPLPKLAKSLGIKELYVKDESKRFRINTFKSLGASYGIAKVIEKRKKEKLVFCTATDGNHGRSVAWAARNVRQKAVIFVPKNTTALRIKNIKKHRGEVIVVDGDYDHAVAAAREESQKKGYVLIQDNSWEGYTEIPKYIAAGYKTMMTEMENTLHPDKVPLVDLVFLECDSLMESFKNGKLSKTKGSQQTALVGLNCGTPSLLAWEILKDAIDLFLAIPDSYAIKAMKDLYYPFKGDKQIFAGESGAAGLGGLIALVSDPDLGDLKKQIGLNEESRVLVFVTEGVTDPDVFEELITTEINFAKA
ncbi:MAG: hypothetical protein AMS27_12865 [Bacteroides sp. SM23_62_1]|nr:MAG: hypothetical protein AMS27_12865 [Bacteroides sp. SM23_62_1]